MGFYSMETEFADDNGSLKSIGHFPFVIKDENESFRLLIGAFFTREGAERQHHDLQTNPVNFF